MKLLVFGATGPTGQQLVRQALERGHAVTAFIRTPGSLPISHERLRVLTGNVTRDAGSVAEAVAGQDVVVSALGRHNSLRSRHLMARSASIIVAAMAPTGVRRLVLVSALGVGSTRGDAPLVPRIMHRVLLSGLFQDKQVAEDLVRASGLDWTFVYPVMLTNGPLTGKYRAGERLALRGVPKISRADVAHFILNEIDQRAFVRKTAVVSD